MTLQAAPKMLFGRRAGVTDDSPLRLWCRSNTLQLVGSGLQCGKRGADIGLMCQLKAAAEDASQIGTKIASSLNRSTG